jgi:hypothetical protein
MIPFDQYNLATNSLYGSFKPFPNSKINLKELNIPNSDKTRITYDNGKSDITFRFLNDKSGSFITEGDMNSGYKIEPTYYSYTSMIKKFTVTNVDGTIYEFGEVVKNSHSTSNFGDYETYDNLPYITTWLLTSIKSPDYVDRGESGLTEDDFGFWVKFDYSKKKDMAYRTPATGYNVTKTGQKTFHSGLKQIKYLNSIRTKTHKVVFHLSDKGARRDQLSRSISNVNMFIPSVRADGYGTNQVLNKGSIKYVDEYGTTQTKPIATFFNNHSQFVSNRLNYPGTDVPRMIVDGKESGEFVEPKVINNAPETNIRALFSIPSYLHDLDEESQKNIRLTFYFREIYFWKYANRDMISCTSTYKMTPWVYSYGAGNTVLAPKASGKMYKEGLTEVREVSVSFYDYKNSNYNIKLPRGVKKGFLKYGICMVFLIPLEPRDERFVPTYIGMYPLGVQIEDLGEELQLSPDHNSTHYLESVSLYKKGKQFDQLIKGYDFKYDYTLVNNYPVSESEKSGKLTLKKIQPFDSEYKYLPAYTFEYNNTRDFDKEKWDSWGNYSSEGVYTDLDNERVPYDQKVSQSKSDADLDASEYKLSKITFPNFSELAINYESDQFKLNNSGPLEFGGGARVREIGFTTIEGKTETTAYSYSNGSILAYPPYLNNNKPSVLDYDNSGIHSLVLYGNVTEKKFFNEKIENEVKYSYGKNIFINNFEEVNPLAGALLKVETYDHSLEYIYTKPSNAYAVQNIDGGIKNKDVSNLGKISVSTQTKMLNGTVSEYKEEYTTPSFYGTKQKDRNGKIIETKFNRFNYDTGQPLEKIEKTNGLKIKSTFRPAYWDYPYLGEKNRLDEFSQKTVEFNGELISSEYIKYNFFSVYDKDEIVKDIYFKPAEIYTSTKTTEFQESIAYGRKNKDWKKTKKINSYNKYGSITETETIDGVKNSYYSSEKNNMIIASITNGALTDVFFENFEENQSKNHVSSDSHSGIFSFDARNGYKIKVPKVSKLEYSLWVKGNYAVSGQNFVTASGTTNIWKLIKGFVNGKQVSELTISGGLIDDIRIHPNGAYVTSYT